MPTPKVIICGASAGLASEIALALKEMPCHCISVGKAEDAVKELASEIRPLEHVACEVLTSDLPDIEQLALRVREGIEEPFFEPQKRNCPTMRQRLNKRGR